MYFCFVYGILFDGCIITRKTQKSHRNTENKKANRGDDVYRPPQPHTESTEINGMHEKGPGVEEWETFFFQKRIAFIIFLIPGAKNDSGCTRRLRPTPVPLFVYSVDLRVGRGTRTTLAEQIFDLRFRGFCVGDGGGNYMYPAQPILFIFRVSV